MTWVFLLASLALIAYAYRGRRDTVSAPLAAASDGSSLDVVDFYWRPG